MKTLYERLMDWRFNQEGKHGYEPGTAEQWLNDLSNHDFLYELSGALEQMFEELGITPRT